MIAFGILFHRANYKCMHSQLQQRTNVHYYNTSNRTIQSTFEWKKFRLAVNYSSLTSSETSCKHVGQSIRDIVNNVEYICQQKDIVTEKHVKVVKGTMENVVRFMGNLLSVIPLEDGYKSPKKGHVYRNTDFVLRATINSCGADCAMLAAATYNEVEPRFNRPISGLCVINVREIPEEVSDFDSKKNLLFNTLVHEITHALGFTYLYYDFMHPPENPTPYQNHICQLQKYGKKYTFLTTPMAHRFAVNHYGVDVFIGDNGDKCLSGLELEDGGGLGTAYSHFESRTLLSDIMVGVSIASNGIHFMRLTDATLAFLLDTGNYKVNWSMAQPLVWGNPESIDGKPIKDFALGPPQTTFPEGYLGNESDDNQILFNFKGLGKTDQNIKVSIDELGCGEILDEEIMNICDQMPFINPKSLPYITIDPVFDYSSLKYPITDCQDGKAVLNGNYTKCVKYICNEFESFIADIPDYGKLACDKTTIGKYIQFKDSKKHSYRVSCPNPERFCRTVKLHEMHFVRDPFILNVKQLVPDDNNITNSNETKQNPEPKNDGSITQEHNPVDQDNGNIPTKKSHNLYIIIGVVCGVLLIAIIAGVSLFIIYKNTNVANPDNEESQEP